MALKLLTIQLLKRWVIRQSDVLRVGDRSPVLRLRQGYGACTLLAVVFLSIN
jgi:hypothetical protein